MRTILHKLPGLRTKRFSFRLFAAFASLTVVVSSLLLWGIYASAREDLMESERRLSTDLLTQVRYNLVSLDEMNRTLCFSVLHSNEAQSLLYNTQPDNYQLMLQRNSLANSLANNPFVHSVYLYNQALNTFYSTYKSFHYVDADFLAQLDTGALTSNLKPLVRELDGNVVLTYGLSELYGNAERSVAVYVNIHLDYLIDNLEVFDGGQLLAFDQSGRLINRFTDRGHVPDTLLTALVQAMPESVSSEQADMVMLQVPSMPLQSATMLYCPQLGWTLVKVSPYHEVFSRTERLRATILIFSACAVLMNIVLCYLLARRMYRPIQHVIDQVAVDSPGAVIGDEFAYLSRFYQEMRGELAELKQQRQNRMLQSDLALQKLLLQSHMMDQGEREGLVEEYGIRVDIHRSIRLLVFIADDFAQLPPEFAQESERPLLLFGLRNLLEEAFGKVPNFALSYPEGQYLTMLMNPDPAGKIELTDQIKSFQSAALSYFNLPVAAAVSEQINAAERISDAYARMRNLLAERFIQGKDFIAYEDESKPTPPTSGAEIAECLKRLGLSIEKGGFRLRDAGSLRLFRISCPNGYVGRYVTDYPAAIGDARRATQAEQQPRRSRGFRRNYAGRRHHPVEDVAGIPCPGDVCSQRNEAGGGCQIPYGDACRVYSLHH